MESKKYGLLPTEENPVNVEALTGFSRAKQQHLIEKFLEEPSIVHWVNLMIAQAISEKILF